MKSKVKRFSLEERYGYQNRKVIYDKNSDNDIELNNIYPIIGLLNQFGEQISDLQHRLEVAEKALELACKEELREIGIYPDDLDYKKEMSILEQQYKEQAEKEIKGEKL